MRLGQTLILCSISGNIAVTVLTCIYKFDFTDTVDNMRATNPFSDLVGAQNKPRNFGLRIRKQHGGTRYYKGIAKAIRDRNNESHMDTIKVKCRGFLSMSRKHYDSGLSLEVWAQNYRKYC
jgi:hypothetical protein